MHPLADPDRPILVMLGHDFVVGFDRTDGGILWRVELTSGKKGDFIIAGGRVFIIQANELTCLEYTTGKLLGRVELPFRDGSDHPKMVWDSGELFIMDSYTVACVSVDGRPKWTQDDLRSAGQKAAFGFPGNISRPDFTR